MRIDQRTTIRWTGDGDVYRGARPGGTEVLIDTDGMKGPSPMDALLLALSSCMAIDVRMILEKSRVPLTDIEVAAEAERNEDPPRRFRSIRLLYRLVGPGPEDTQKVQRAIDLSRDRYCSVIHSLAADIEFTIEVETD